jgi:hypothetical protein
MQLYPPSGLRCIKHFLMSCIDKVLFTLQCNVGFYSPSSVDGAQRQSNRSFSIHMKCGHREQFHSIPRVSQQVFSRETLSTPHQGSSIVRRPLWAGRCSPAKNRVVLVQSLPF